MAPTEPQFNLRLARDQADIEAAQRLRYEVFVEELGSNGDLVDHDQRLERDRFDPFFDHLLLVDDQRAGAVVGVYRLMPPEGVAAAGQYYSEDEYDLTPLRATGRRLLELGRSCVHRDYRGGAAMFHLWQGLGAYVLERKIEVLFGVASFHGTDIDALAPALSLLQDRHLAPEDLRVRARTYQPMNLLQPGAYDRVAAMRSVPALIKAYLRLGGFVGDGAFIDHAFNTTDVCLVMDTARMSDATKATYTAGVA